MPLPSSGPLSLSQIQGEFGGSNPISLSEYYAGGAFVPSGTSGTYGAVPSSGTISIRNFYGTQKVVAGQVEYTSAGVYTWVCPAGVTSISVVCVGGGGGGAYGGGGGGGLGYINNYAVTPGASYTLQVGSGGFYNVGSSYSATDGTTSYFVSTGTVYGGGGFSNSSATGGGYGGSGGGSGGTAGNDVGLGGGGGGAGGYTGNGGGGGSTYSFAATSGASGSGGGAGGGAGSPYNDYGYIYKNASGAGGGVSIYGQGASGGGGSPNGGGGDGGSGGAVGGSASIPSYAGGYGGLYGGGAGAGGYESDGVNIIVNGIGGGGASGAVRIIWPGNTRQFPSTNTGNL